MPKEGKRLLLMFIRKNNFYISPEDYLEGERVSPIKHEYRRGHVYAMTGAKKPHQVLASNFIKLLGNHLEDTKCLVLTSDAKIRREEANCYYYPDVTVTCDERDTTSTDDFILYPVLIIEVLSPSTEAFDRGDKFADYQTAPKLQEYVLVSQTEMKIECYRLDREGNWISEVYNIGDDIYLARVDFRTQFQGIYLKVPGI
jgi:Uma2 family endonuclease